MKANDELNLTKVDAKFKPHLITNWIECVAQSHDAREEAYPILGLKSIILVSIVLLCTSPFIHNAWHKIKNYIKQELKKWSLVKNRKIFHINRHGDGWNARITNQWLWNK